MTAQARDRYVAVCSRLDEGRRVADICRELGVSRFYVYRVRDGERSVPSRHHVMSADRRRARSALDAAWEKFTQDQTPANYARLWDAREVYDSAR